MRSHLFVTFAVLAWSTVAAAQDVECKKTETQAECFARLKCKANEELEDCQKRLRAAGDAAKQDNSGQQQQQQQQQNNNNGTRGDDSRGRDRDDRGDDRRADDDRSGGGRSRRGGGGGGGGRRGGRGRGGGHAYTAEKTFGLGLELGEPAGLNGKYFVSDSGALDFGVGWIYSHYYYGDGFHLYADYLFHVGLTSNPTFQLPFYIGGGLRLWDFRYCVGNVCDYGGTAIGIRIPIGISFDFNNAPVDIFLQLVPVIDFVNGDYYDRYRDREHFGIDGSVGVRFWFK